ncbi:MocR-like pyridoxine biosynthesis transcription factor PdxR [Streptomyces sp. NBC_01423]|uniref:MocR-like pyridoxine biosynthesis transcription factor PdxR n=1 Tax=Streptomyces sp. NBC_01423 TaxID=2903860 RepID=UPI002E29C997|nr:PLP-dependent aminotransferase family protein [Streptomyces sp. NBC_01423]
MADSWVNSAQRAGSDLHLDLSGPGSRRAVLIRALRDAVREGRLPPGTRLPAYRSLAADLGLARNTVADAYAELVAEGWLAARQGSGTRVAERASPPRPLRRSPTAPVRPAAPAYDLRQGTPETASFPRTGWLTSARRALNTAPDDAFGPGDPRGRIELRRALSDYLTRARGVRVTPERIVVCSGFAHALRLLFGGSAGGGAGPLRGPVGVEAYGLPFHRGILEGSGARTVPLDLDEGGARIEQLAGEPRVRGVLLTPAHQFPTGGPLAAVRRAAVIDWARANDALVLEDDYDGEFRYDRVPVGALQGLDPERVVHLGSVSKSLSPAVRLGWMVLPAHLVDGVLAAKGEREAWASVPDQLTLADFIESGRYDRHVRRMRQRYRHRRDRLVTALADRAPHVTATGIAAGLHAVLRLPPGTEASVVKAASWQGLAVDGLSAFRHPGAVMPGADGLVVGYSTPSERAYGAAVDALIGCLPPSDAVPEGPPR